jgi:hypothetical protein
MTSDLIHEKVGQTQFQATTTLIEQMLARTYKPIHNPAKINYLTRKVLLVLGVT